MNWLLILIIGVLLYTKMNELIKLQKENHPTYINKQELEKEQYLEEQLEIRHHLQELINCDCLIISTYLVYLSYPTSKIQAKVLYVDDDWVEISTMKKNKEIHLILAIKNITGLSKII